MTIIMEIGRRCELAGVRVVRAPGCESRGNGQSWPTRPEGVLNHHTAGARNIYLDQLLLSGRRDLPGPLTNFATLYDGDLALVAAHPANHAGASGGWDTAPLPVTRVFNRLMVGNEIQYPGTEPMSPAQWRTVVIFNRIALDVIGRSGQWNRIKFHNGTSVTGKWDPGYAPGKTYDIAAFRRAVAQQSTPQAPGGIEDMALDTPFIDSYGNRQTIESWMKIQDRYNAETRDMVNELREALVAPTIQSRVEPGKYNAPVFLSAIHGDLNIKLDKIMAKLGMEGASNPKVG